MAVRRIKSRYQQLTFDEAGEKPTLPNPLTLEPDDVGFRTTDIVDGELAYNSVDKIWYYRSGDQIEQFVKVITLTQNEFNAIAEPNEDTLYFITDATGLGGKIVINSQGGANYVAQLSDAGALSIIQKTNAGANTVQINQGVFSEGDQFNVLQSGAGQVQITAGANVVLTGDKNEAGQSKISGQHRIVTVICLNDGATQVFLIIGALEIPDPLLNVQSGPHSSSGVLALNCKDRKRSLFTVNASADITGLNVTAIQAGSKFTFIVEATGEIDVTFSVGKLDGFTSPVTLTDEFAVFKAVYNGSNLYWYR